MSIGSVGSSGVSAYQRPTFDSADKNGDGSLSLDELEAVGQNVPGGKNGFSKDDIASLFSAIDTDGSGGISKTEGKAAYDKLSNAVQSQLLGVQEQSGQPPSSSSSPVDAKKTGHHHHHGGAPPAVSPTDPSSTDQSAIDPLTGDASSSDPLSAQQTSGQINDLFLKAVSAYSNPTGSASAIASQILDALKTV